MAGLLRSPGMLLVLCALGCTGRDVPAGAARERASPRPEPETPVALVARTPALSPDIIDPYEQIRSDLAAGRLDRVWEAAGRIETGAGAAAATGTGGLRANYEAIAEAAARLREAPRDDAEEARRSFGEVSRHLVALVRAEPALGEGLSVHECAAAMGYRKWVQRGGEVGNPYVAAGAAPCDAASNWEP